MGLAVVLDVYRWALGYNWRRNVRLIRRHGVAPWAAGRLVARHAGRGRGARWHRGWHRDGIPVHSLLVAARGWPRRA